MKTGIALFILFLSLIIAGCSNDLSRSEAAGAIQRRINNDILSPLNIRTDLVTHVGRMGKPCEKKIYTNPLDATNTLLRNLGYMNIKNSGEFVDVQLTAFGQAFVDGLQEKGYAPYSDQSGCSYQQLNLPFGKLHLVRVMGISRNENISEVEYHWDWVLNDLGKQLVEGSSAFAKLPNTPIIEYELTHYGLPIPKVQAENGGYAKVRFKLYDDGWRMEEPKD